MKKLFFVTLLATMILFAGCRGMDALEQLLPHENDNLVQENVSEESSAEALSDNEEDIISEEISVDSESENAPEGVLEEEYFDLELVITENPRVAELLNVSGSYTDSVGNVDNYHYQIPQFYTDSENVKALNERILYDIVDNIHDEFFCMEQGYSLFCYNITYEVIENGDIVAILVSVPYPNDCVEYYAYTYDFEQDKEITNVELLAMYDWTEEAFLTEAYRREKEHFKNQVSSIYPDMTEAEMDYYIQSAIDVTTLDLPMYIGSDGLLYVYLPMPSAAGADWYYGLETF